MGKKSIHEEEAVAAVGSGGGEVGTNADLGTVPSPAFAIINRPGLSFRAGRRGGKRLGKGKKRDVSCKGIDKLIRLLSGK